MTKLSSTYLYQHLGFILLDSMASCSNASIKILAITGDRGDPIAAPLAWMYSMMAAILRRASRTKKAFISLKDLTMKKLLEVKSTTKPSSNRSQLVLEGDSTDHALLDSDES
ncbi:hypothetical protein Trydic_g17259 [Trypoxylus dichotomus]